MDKNSFYILFPIFIIFQSTAADAHSSVNESDQNPDWPKHKHKFLHP